ncbi:MAG: glycosyltransferase family 4 protein [Vicinamibacterales bacterium]
MTRRLRIAQVAPVATCVPPALSGSIESATSLLTEGLVQRGHDVTLFATGDSITSARLHATFPRGYRDDDSIWPWELCELFNLAAAVERSGDFDIVHYQAEYYPMSLAFSRTSPVPVVQTLHHAPDPAEIALWSRYPEAPFIAISSAQAVMLQGLHVAATIPHALDMGRFPFRAEPDDYLVFLGRFTPGKGVVEAIDVARRAGLRLRLAAAANDYYRDVVAPLVDGEHVEYVGEVDHAAKVDLLGRARALLYPVQAAEPFGLVLAEAMACGTPVAALGLGAVRELVDEGRTGRVFDHLDAMTAGLSGVMDLDRHVVRSTAEARFGVEPMVTAHLHAYDTIIAAQRARTGGF